jgi:hypothetical protein
MLKKRKGMGKSHFKFDRQGLLARI